MDPKFLKKTPFYSILLPNLQHLKKLSSPRQLYPIISPIDSSDIQINQEKGQNATKNFCKKWSNFVCQNRPSKAGSYRGVPKSYAELITIAIEQSPRGKLMLSEIYSWMFQNVPEFSDKRLPPSETSWKNSIRHNLSLHDKFQKVSIKIILRILCQMRTIFRNWIPKVRKVHFGLSVSAQSVLVTRVGHR